MHIEYEVRVLHINKDNLIKKLEELENITNSPDFWQNPEKSTPILTKMKKNTLCY